MPKDRASHVTRENGDEVHPAFGMISVHRVSSTPGETLFQSDLQHPEYIRVTVHEASRKRDLKRDWVHPGKMVCEISLSLTQFASFVASAGTQGVPCTIEFTGSGDHEPGSRPGLEPASRLAITTDEVRAAAASAYGNIKDALAEYEKVLAGNAGIALRRSALAKLRSLVANAAPNVDYATRTLNEHAEAVVEKSRADIEAMVIRAAGQAGISPAQVARLPIEGAHGKKGAHP